MKNVFIQKNGNRMEVDQFMQGPNLSDGYWWTSTGHKEWTETVKPHSSNFLFGYEPEKLLSMQYR